MGLKSTFINDQDRMGAGTVDKYINTAYDEMKSLSDNLDDLLVVAATLPQLTKYLGSYSVPPTERPNGDTLEDGDYYFDTTSNAIVYYNLSMDSWFAIDPSELVQARDEAVAARDAAQASQAVAELEASNASESAISALNSENAASASQAAAASSESNAHNSELSASSSAIAAAQSSLDAETVFDNFNALYLGAKTVEPLLDNEGNPLQVGATYWNSNNNLLYYWDGSTWTENSSILVTQEFTVDLADGQTVVTAPRDLDNVVVFVIDSITGNERLVQDVDFTVDVDNVTITLNESYNSGSKLYFVFNDIDNAEGYATDLDVTEAQEDLLPLGSSLFKGGDSVTVKDGDNVPSGTTHLRVLVGGEPTIVAMSPVASGVVSLLTETDANVGGTLVTLHVFSNGGYQATDAQLQNITPRIGEQWFNTDDNSTRIGDGVTIGGRKVFNNYDFNGQFLLNKTNNTKTDQELFDEIQSDSNQGNIVKIMDGEFSGNFETSKTPLMGIGASSVLTTPNASPTLTLKRHTPDWDYYKVSSITVNGGESNARCISFDPNDPFAGRWIFDNVMMRDGSRGVAKPRGNIGDVIKNCTFINLDYGYRALGDASNPMHGGSTTMVQSHMDNINVACYMSEDSVDGGGGYVIKDTIFEQCPGFGVYLDFTGVGAPYTPPSANNLWLEAVATAPSVNLDGNAVAPREFYLKDVNPYIVRDTFFKNIELINSTMIAEKCRIDDSFGSGFSLNVDDDSVLICDDLYANGQIGGVPFVRSILRQIDTSGTRNLGVRGPLKNSQIPLANVGNATNIASNSYSGAGPWVFNGTFNTNATSVTDGVLNDTCAELVVQNNFTLYGESIGTPTVGKWAVWSIHAKQVSGNGFSVATIGFNWKCGDIYLKQGQWVRSYGIQKVGSDASSCRLQFINTSGGNSTIRLADFYLVEFDTYDEAIEFCNSRTSIKNEI
ncbi:tail fiber protein [Pseudoalteromonas phage pYD6-A]|uniref:Tail fiber protein n=1 Tax=Pseudoalteromonas phage pYD6-A TaxID=754052 RepID=M4SQP2_9CAUD|nr:tail fiber protein [Pseudoalteromonas phage pYD6-A]AGH57625.1 hypothetical protein PYDG_00096 [Pseudoalteromonas phage pYD6-A]